jgi:hypothetical protein
MRSVMETFPDLGSEIICSSGANLDPNILGSGPVFCFTFYNSGPKIFVIIVICTSAS